MGDKFKLLIKNVNLFNSIKEGDKLIINSDNELVIDEPYFFRPIVRYFYSNNREKSHKFIAKLIDDLSIELAKFYIYSINQSKFSSDEINIKDFNEYDDYFIRYKKMKYSINIISETYKKDKSYSRKLKLTCDLIDKLNPPYRNYANF